MTKFFNRQLLMLVMLLLMMVQVAAAQSITGVSVSQAQAGVVQIVIDGSDDFTDRPASFAIDTPPRIIIDLEASSALQEDTLPIQLGDVDRLQVVDAGERTRLVVDLQRTLPYEVQTNGRQLTLLIGSPDETSPSMAPGPRDPLASERLSLNFQDIEVRSVLQLLADFTGLNMVVSDTVGGNVTLRLRDVHWREALDIILKTKGLTMRQDGNIIMVAPMAEVAMQEQMEAEAVLRMQELSPLVSDMIQVKYAKANDLAELIKAADNKLLSDRGNVTVDSRTNTLLLRDTQEAIGNIRSLLDTLDRPIQQVMIEARIVIANDDFSRDLGVRLGFVGDADRSDLINAGTAALLAAENPVLGSRDSSSFIQGVFNRNAGVLDLELRAMQTEGRGEIISSPRVLTSDQKKAVIKQGIEIPYREAASSGAVSVSFKEAVLKLEVLPHITPDNKVFMELDVNKDNADVQVNSLEGSLPINTQAIQTSVLVGDGETIVLGGVFEIEEFNSASKVPLLGDVPGLGRLFRSDGKTTKKRELLIFVTPRIIRN